MKWLFAVLVALNIIVFGGEGDARRNGQVAQATAQPAGRLRLAVCCAIASFIRLKPGMMLPPK